jgi:biotin transporter BioY
MIVPAAFLAGVLLLRRSAFGYLLSSVFVMKAITLGLGVSAMGINMSLAGVPDSLGIVVPFLAITLLNLVAAVALLRNVTD